MNVKSLLLLVLCVLVAAAGTSSGYAAPAFGSTSRQAVFISPLEKWMPSWNMNLDVSLLEHAGYHVDVFLAEDASISFLESNLGKYDLIILRTDTFTSEGMRYYCAGDHADANARATFAGEITLKEVGVAACVGFSVSFLKHYYPASSLQKGLVYMPGSYSAELASAFLAAGAAAFIGYTEGHNMQWGVLDAYSLKILGYLSHGYSVADTMIQLYIYLYTGHGKSASWVAPYWAGDGTYKI